MRSRQAILAACLPQTPARQHAVQESTHQAPHQPLARVFTPVAKSHQMQTADKPTAPAREASRACSTAVRPCCGLGQPQLCLGAHDSGSSTT